MRNSRNPLQKSKLNNFHDPKFSFVIQIPERFNNKAVDQHLYALYQLLVKNGPPDKRRKLQNRIIQTISELSLLASPQNNSSTITQFEKLTLWDFQIQEGSVKSKLQKLPLSQVINNLKTLNRHIELAKTSASYEQKNMRQSKSNIIPITSALNYLIAQQLSQNKKASLFQLAAKSLGFRQQTQKCYLTTIYTFEDKGLYNYSVEYSRKQRAYFYLREEIQFKINGQNLSNAFIQITDETQLDNNMKQSVFVRNSLEASSQMEQSEIYEQSIQLCSSQKKAYKLDQQSETVSQNLNKDADELFGQINFKRKQSNQDHQQNKDYQSKSEPKLHSQKMIKIPKDLTIQITQVTQNQMQESVAHKNGDMLAQQKDIFQTSFCDILQHKHEQGMFQHTKSQQGQCKIEGQKKERFLGIQKQQQQYKYHIDTGMNMSQQRNKHNIRIVLQDRLSPIQEQPCLSSRYLHSNWNHKKIEVDLTQQQKIQPLGQQLHNRVKSPRGSERGSRNLIMQGQIQQNKTCSKSKLKLKRKRSKSFELKNFDASLPVFSPFSPKESRCHEYLQVWDEPLYASLLTKLTGRINTP